MELQASFGAGLILLKKYIFIYIQAPGNCVTLMWPRGVKDNILHLKIIKDNFTLPLFQIGLCEIKTIFCS